MDWKKQRFMIRSNSSINKSSITKPTDRMEEYKRNKNDGDGASTEQGQVFAGPATNVAECSMCGDVGLVRNLFRCSRCNSRYQHTYCSNWYPHERSIYIEVCNWCAPEAMGKAMNAALTTSHPTTRHMDHVENTHQNNNVDADNNNDKNDDVGMPMYSTPRKTHDHDHHPAHAHHRLIKKTSKRLVVRRYKFVSEV